MGKRGVDPYHPWKDGFDTFSKRGYKMVPVLVGAAIPSNSTSIHSNRCLGASSDAAHCATYADDDELSDHG